MFHSHEAASVAIIGGADGPTAIFLSSRIPLLFPLLFFGCIAVAIGLCIYYFFKSR